MIALYQKLIDGFEIGKARKESGLRSPIHRSLLEQVHQTHPPAMANAAWLVG